MSLEAQSTTVANPGELEKLRARVQELERDKKNLEALLAKAEQENRDFALMCVQLQEKNTAVTNLYVASHRLHATLEPDEVLGIIKEILAELVGAEDFGILMLDKERQTLELVASEGVEQRLPSRSIPSGEGVIGEVAKSREPFFLELDSEAARSSKLPLAAVPLTIDEETMGVIVIFKLLSQKSGFSAVDHMVLELLASHAATALLAARLHGAVDRRLKTVQGFVQLMKEGKAE